MYSIRKAGVRVKIFRGRKLNKKGMTLIEVVAAMAILAIVITPVLRIFASTSGTNLRSRRRQRATVVAEATMESFKAYNVEQLCKQFMSGGFKGTENMVSSGTPTTMSVVGVYATGESSPLKADQTLNRDASAYRFNINNVASESVLYDVEVMVTPDTSHTAEMLYVENTNEYSDAIISLDEDMGYDALSEFETFAKTKFEAYFASAHSGATSHSIDDVEISKLKRLIELEVSDSGSTQSVKVKVTYTCEAKVKYKYMSGPVGSATSNSDSVTFDDSVMKLECKLPDDSSTETEWTVYDNSSTIGGVNVDGKQSKLNNIFLYYFPTYKSVYGAEAGDEIKISGNLTNLYKASASSDPRAEGYEALKVSVMKQLATTMDDTSLNSGEVGYDVDLSGSFSGNGEIELYTNLSENFSPLGSVCKTPSISGFGTVESSEKRLYDTFITLYNVEVHVYDAGTTDEVAYFSGTIND